jgi:predicted CXXCH cytochrome family protein
MPGLAAGLALAAAVTAAGPAAAFHDGGVARCAACHVTHEGDPGQVIIVGDNPLLTAATPTDVCLSCHGAPSGVFGLNPVVPPPERGAGNFVFLLEDNLNDAPGGALSPIHGEAAGHSIVSMDYGTGPDSRWTNAPGGTFPSASLGCTSCHDPHGNGNFRMLNGTGPVQGGIYQFTYGAPEGEGLDITDPLAVEAQDLHSAYRGGMDDWCANCHGRYHDNERGPSGFEHEFNESLGGSEQSQYNRYAGAANPTGGSAATAYLPQVPFEAAAMTTTSTAGPSGGAFAMCLTCHRAHASSGPAAGRWDFRVSRLADDGAASGSWPLPNPYGAANEGQLCVKCHMADSPYDTPYKPGPDLDSPTGTP